MSNNITKKQFSINALWKLMESYSAKGISLVISIILARILMPHHYGVITLTTIFINLADILIEGGFTTTLIRKKEIDDYDFSCVFLASVSIASFLYIIYFISAPLISNYYNEPSLSPVLRVLGLTVFIQAFMTTRTIVVNRNMQFKFLCYCNIAGSLISGIIGILAAYKGMGVWALVIQRILQQLLITGLLFLKVKFKFKWKFSMQRLREIMKFSIGVFGASLIYFIGGSMYNAVIGKRYSIIELGYYTKGCQLPEQISLYTFSAFSSVLLPTISSYQENIAQVKHIIRKVTTMTGFIIFPLMIGLIFTSKEIITLLFTEKWLPVVPIMKGWAIYYIAMPFTLINSQVYYALGHSFTRVKTELVRVILMAAGLIFASFWLKCDIAVLSYIVGGIMIVSAIVTAVYAGRMLSYKFSEMCSDLVKPFFISVLMGVFIYLIDEFLVIISINGVLIPFIIKVVIGMIVYIGFSVILKSEGVKEVIYVTKIIFEK